MVNCVFCEIVDEKVPAYKIAENNYFLAFLDIHPLSEGHTLVIPKKHYATVWDMPAVELSDLVEFAREISRHYQYVTRNDLVYMLVLGGEVPHAAIHIIPNYEKDFQYALKECIDRSAKRNPLNTDDAYYLSGKYRLK